MGDFSSTLMRKPHKCTHIVAMFRLIVNVMLICGFPRSDWHAKSSNNELSTTEQVFNVR